MWLCYFLSAVFPSVTETGEIPDVKPTGLTMCAEVCIMWKGDNCRGHVKLRIEKLLRWWWMCVEVVPSDVDFDNGYILMPLKSPRLVEESVEINTHANVEMYLPSPGIVDVVGGDWCMSEENPRVLRWGPQVCCNATVDLFVWKWRWDELGLGVIGNSNVINEISGKNVTGRKWDRIQCHEWFKIEQNGM